MTTIKDSTVNWTLTYEELHTLRDLVHQTLYRSESDEDKEYYSMLLGKLVIRDE